MFRLKSTRKSLEIVLNDVAQQFMQQQVRIDMTINVFSPPKKKNTINRT